MSLKPLLIFLVILCISKTRCDISHALLGGESPVDTGTIEVLRKNISDYLVELEHGGSPQMKLKNIYSASKQIVTGTLYTVQALLETPDGAKNCQIRVLEKPWVDFCKVSVSCENGGHYEVTFNPNQINQDISQELKPISHLLPPSVYNQQPESQSNLNSYQQSINPAGSLSQNSFLNQFTTTQVQSKNPLSNQFTTTHTQSHNQFLDQFPSNHFQRKLPPFTTAKSFTTTHKPLAPLKFSINPLHPFELKPTHQPLPELNYGLKQKPLPQKYDFKSQQGFNYQPTVKPLQFPTSTKFNVKSETKFLPQIPQNKHQFGKLPSFTTTKPFTTTHKPQPPPVLPQIPQTNHQSVFEFKEQPKPPQFPAVPHLEVLPPAPAPASAVFNKQLKHPQFPVAPHLEVLPPAPASAVFNKHPKHPQFPVAPHVEVLPPAPTPPPPTTATTQAPTPAPAVFNEQPKHQQFSVAPHVEVLPPAPAVYKPEPIQPDFPIQPASFEFKPEPFQHDFPIQATLTPNSLPAPELKVIPEEQLPHGEALESYLNDLFHDFMVKYEREYIDVPHEMEYRFEVFKNNFHTMQEHSRTDRLACQYSLTEFSDLTNSEFERILGFDTSLLNVTDIENATIPAGAAGSAGEGGADLPEHYDQRDENLVTRIKFQGDCGACWAFVTTAVIEGLCAKRTKTLQEFSEQSLIDCDNSNYGCIGGVPPNAMKHIAKRGGLELETIYQYVYGKSTCHFDPKTVRVKVAGVIGFKKNDEAGMARWLFKNGPILVGINADPLKYYKSGVLNPTPQLCSTKKINHAVTLIGYGVEINTTTGEKLPYWIAKNQWGTRFGEDGFLRIARGKNACGLALWAYSAKLSTVPNNCLLNGA